MNIAIGKKELQEYMRKQLNTFFPDSYDFYGKDVDIAFELAVERLEYCFQYISLPSYCDDSGQTYFSHLHSDQYSQFMYYLSNSLWKTSQNKPLCDKIILLNKMLNGMFYSYKGELPDIFLFGHPVGSVLGNAVYSNYLVVLQNVTVNTSADENGNLAPVLGKGLFLGAGAKIIGNKKIGDRVSIGVDAVVQNIEIPDDQTVLHGKDGNLIIRNRFSSQCKAQDYFNVPIE